MNIIEHMKADGDNPDLDMKEDAYRKKLVLVLSIQGKYDEAITHARVLAQRPGNQDVYYQTINVLTEARDRRLMPIYLTYPKSLDSEPIRMNNNAQYMPETTVEQRPITDFKGLSIAPDILPKDSDIYLNVPINVVPALF